MLGLLIMANGGWGFEAFIFLVFSPKNWQHVKIVAYFLSLPSVWDPLGRSKKLNYRLLTPSVHRVHPYVKLLGVFTICISSKKMVGPIKWNVGLQLEILSLAPPKLTMDVCWSSILNLFPNWIIIQFACNLCVRFAQLLAHISH